MKKKFSSFLRTFIAANKTFFFGTFEPDFKKIFLICHFKVYYVLQFISATIYCNHQKKVQMLVCSRKKISFKKISIVKGPKMDSYGLSLIMP